MKLLNRLLLFAGLIGLFVACGGSKDSGSSDQAPANLQVSATVASDSSGNVSFTAKADHAVNYDFDFGNGVFQAVPSGSVTYKYPASGTYTVNVVAKSAGGQIASKSVQVTVAVKLSLVFDEEFDAPGAPNAAKWGYDTGEGGWGNNELQYYTNRTDNAVVSNGTLKIIAKKENYGTSAYTSARLLTKGKFSFQYGKVEVRAKLPASAGTWPAIWMLGDNISSVGWPACGEIDIMEHRGIELNKIFGTVHDTNSGGAGNGGTTTITGAATDFHLYGLEWNAGSIKFYVDNNLYFSFANNAALPFNQKFFLILNVAMGGNFGGTVDPAFASDQMEIDYVRVYQ